MVVGHASNDRTNERSSIDRMVKEQTMFIQRTLTPARVDMQRMWIKRYFNVAAKTITAIYLTLRELFASETYSIWFNKFTTTHEKIPRLNNFFGAFRLALNFACPVRGRHYYNCILRETNLDNRLGHPLPPETIH